MTHRRTCIGACLLLALLPAGCAPISVQVDYDPKADFSGYRTWGWLPEPKPTGNPRADDERVHRRIREAIEAQLASQGFTAAGDPQIRVGYHVSTQKKVDVRTVSSPYAHQYWDGRNTQIRAEARTYVTEEDRGTLVIDVVDTARGALVWRGLGERRLRREPTPDQMKKSVRQAVAQVLERFPPSGGGQPGD